MTPRNEGQLLVFGGGFDPPHLGHIQALKDCITFVRPKAVLIPVSADPIGKAARATFEQRLAMARLAFSSFNASVLDWEFTQGIRFTTDLLNVIRDRFHVPTTFCVGADQVLQFETWKNFPKLLSQTNWLVLARRGFNEAELQTKIHAWKHSGYFGIGKKEITILPTEALEISSTEVRSLIERDEMSRASELVTREVFSFIEKEGLYGSRNTNSVRR